MELYKDILSKVLMKEESSITFPKSLFTIYEKVAENVVGASTFSATQGR